MRSIALAYTMADKKDKHIVHGFVHTIFKLGLCDMYTTQIIKLTALLVKSRRLHQHKQSHP